jgi:hypothetical protein
MIKTITIVPVHTPKLGYAINLLRSWKEFSNNEIAFIFSSEKDRDYLMKHSDCAFRSLIAPSDILCRPNIITAKKFYGLNVLFNEGYSHIGIFDAEVIVVKPFNTNEIYPIIYNKKELKCNRSQEGGRLTEANAKVIGLDDDLREITDNYIQYWWFNEICVYENHDFTDFMHFISQNNKYESIVGPVTDPKYLHDGNQLDRPLIEHYTKFFDYLVYGCYLLKYKQFQLNKLCQNNTYHYGTIEHNSSDVESGIFESYADHNKSHEKHQNIKVIIHLDRK